MTRRAAIDRQILPPFLASLPFFPSARAGIRDIPSAEINLTILDSFIACNWLQALPCPDASDGAEDEYGSPKMGKGESRAGGMNALRRSAGNADKTRPRRNVMFSFQDGLPDFQDHNSLGSGVQGKALISLPNLFSYTPKTATIARSTRKRAPPPPPGAPMGAPSK